MISLIIKSREYQIDKDFKSWVNLHKPFIEIINFMKELSKRGIKTGVITTKGKIFAEKILKQLNIFPEFIFGYEIFFQNLFLVMNPEQKSK